MTCFANLKRSLTVLATVALLGASAPGGAADSGIPMPSFMEPQGTQCVEDTDFMRRNHMDVILDHRDKTMHEGIRTKKHSLKECINCHAADYQGDEKSQEQHFCVSCHQYTAAQPDCFQCHSLKPEQPGAAR